LEELTRYYTKDTVLASYLYMNGIELEKITGDVDAQMTFKGNKEGIEKLVATFKDGNPTGNIIMFFKAYKDVLSQIKER
jgi:hypothetical protein